MYPASNIHDEALFDGLAHRVQMEGLMLAVAVKLAKQFQGAPLGVAVNAKNDRLGCGPRAATASASSTSESPGSMSASASISGSAEPSARRSSLAASPVCDECASSTITA